MTYKQTPLYSIVNNKCPHCHEGNFFIVNNPYNYKKFDKMNEHCPVCEERFEREVGFYYGAMYVSYGITVFFGIIVFSIMCLLLNIDTITFLVVFSALQIILMPIFYRTSRLTWINIFVKYKDKK